MLKCIYGYRYSSDVKTPFVHCVQGSQITAVFEAVYKYKSPGFHAKFYSNGRFFRL